MMLLHVIIVPAPLEEISIAVLSLLKKCAETPLLDNVSVLLSLLSDNRVKVLRCSLSFNMGVPDLFAINGNRGHRPSFQNYPTSLITNTWWKMIKKGVVYKIRWFPVHH